MRETFRPAISPASLVAWRSASLKYAGTVITASVTSSPRYSSASCLSFIKIRAEISWAVYDLSSISAFQSVPIWRLTEEMVRSGLFTACRLAISPVSTSPPLVKATTDGVVREPSAFAMTVGSPPSNTATTEFVVPRSIPTARDIRGSFPQNFCYKLLELSTLKVPQVSTFCQINLSDTDSTLLLRCIALYLYLVFRHHCLFSMLCVIPEQYRLHPGDYALALRHVTLLPYSPTHYWYRWSVWFR